MVTLIDQVNLSKQQNEHHSNLFSVISSATKRTWENACSREKKQKTLCTNLSETLNPKGVQKMPAIRKGSSDLNPVKERREYFSTIQEYKTTNKNQMHHPPQQ
jgi:hypothetical protein